MTKGSVKVPACGRARQDASLLVTELVSASNIALLPEVSGASAATSPAW